MEPSPLAEAPPSRPAAAAADPTPKGSKGGVDLAEFTYNVHPSIHGMCNVGNDVMPW